MAKRINTPGTVQLVLRIRTYRTEAGEVAPYCDVWLLQRDGTAEACLLHGYVPCDAAEAIGAQVGRGVIRERECRRGVPPRGPLSRPQ